MIDFTALPRWIHPDGSAISLTPEGTLMRRPPVSGLWKTVLTPISLKDAHAYVARHFPGYQYRSHLQGSGDRPIIRKQEGKKPPKKGRKLGPRKRDPVYQASQDARIAEHQQRIEKKLKELSEGQP